VTRLECATAQELAAELALGILTGEERGRLIDHVSRCPSCETLVEELSGVVDDLLVVAPEVEPPPGFESRVLTRIAAGQRQTVPPRRRVATRLLAAAAVVTVLAGVLAGAVAFEHRHQPSNLDQRYATALRTLGGQDLRAGALVGRGGMQWGQAFVYEGSTSWVFLTMRWDVPDGSYAVLLDRRSGPSLRLTAIRMAGGEGSLGTTVGDTRDITAVRVLDTSGHTLCRAALTT
jgi:hypothetical protein